MGLEEGHLNTNQRKLPIGVECAFHYISLEFHKRSRRAVSGGSVGRLVQLRSLRPRLREGISSRASYQWLRPRCSESSVNGNKRGHYYEILKF
mmetsp:Transcript_9494/g.14663  ORF Transcript_9494/g.14663 Transcript_9494/m.14663 type:complete len:93 (-) Transcript_9494:1942-2220(-)